MYPDAMLVHESRRGSDHCPILLDLHHARSLRSYRFCFESMWTSFPDCKETVVTTWDSEVSGSQMYSLTQKLNTCRHNLSQWKKENFGKHEAMIESLDGQLKELQALKPTCVNKAVERLICNKINDETP